LIFGKLKQNACFFAPVALALPQSIRARERAKERADVLARDKLKGAKFRASASRI
jgi:hypothetical protein